MNTTKEWQKLTDYLHTRKRTEYLFGSRSPKTISIPTYDGKLSLVSATYVPAIFTAIREIIDNSLDELVVKKLGDTLDVSFNKKTMIVSVKDNGRGIPIDFDKTENEYAATVLLSHTKTGRNFNDDEREDTRGLNGLGAKGVNYCSEFFEVEINRNKKTFNQIFKEGTDELIVEQAIILPSSNKKTGTEIRFKLSEKVFPSLNEGLDEQFLYNRLYETALINPQIKINYNGKRIKPKPLNELLPDCVSFNINADGFKADYFLKAAFSEEYLFWSHVNSIPCFDGGVHEDAFKKYFVPGLISALLRESTKRKLKLASKDILDGLFVYNNINMKAPFFNNQAKTNLTNEHVSSIIKEAFTEDFFKSFIKKNNDFVEKIFDACAERTQKKESKDIKNLAAQNKKAKIAELEDACGRDRLKCILMLAEGLCLDETTKIKTLIDGEWSDKQIKDVNIGDLVISHTGAVRAVTAKSSKVSKGISIKTKYGSMTGSQKHKILVYIISKEIFTFVELSQIDPLDMKLVKSKLNDVSEHVEIKISKTGDVKYPIRIDYGDNYELCSENHRYAVFNIESVKYEMVEAKNLSEEIHAILIK